MDTTVKVFSCIGSLDMLEIAWLVSVVLLIITLYLWHFGPLLSQFWEAMKEDVASLLERQFPPPPRTLEPGTVAVPTGYLSALSTYAEAIQKRIDALETQLASEKIERESLQASFTELNERYAALMAQQGVITPQAVDMEDKEDDKTEESKEDDHETSEAAEHSMTEPRSSSPAPALAQDVPQEDVTTPQSVNTEDKEDNENKERKEDNHETPEAEECSLPDLRPSSPAPTLAQDVPQQNVTTPPQSVNIEDEEDKETKASAEDDNETPENNHETSKAEECSLTDLKPSSPVPTLAQNVPQEGATTPQSVPQSQPTAEKPSSTKAPRPHERRPANYWAGIENAKTFKEDVKDVVEDVLYKHATKTLSDSIWAPKPDAKARASSHQAAPQPVADASADDISKTATGKSSDSLRADKSNAKHRATPQQAKPDAKARASSRQKAAAQPAAWARVQSRSHMNIPKGSSSRPEIQQSSLAAWGNFQAADAERNRQLSQQYAARLAEEERTGTRHQPSLPIMNETWRQVKVDQHGGQRHITGVSKSQHDAAAAQPAAQADAKDRATPHQAVPQPAVKGADKSNAKDRATPQQQAAPQPAVQGAHKSIAKDRAAPHQAAPQPAARAGISGNKTHDKEVANAFVQYMTKNATRNLSDSRWAPKPDAKARAIPQQGWQRSAK